MAATRTAHVPTAHGKKYMTQLLKHWSHKLPVEIADSAGSVRFGETLCTFSAGAEALDVSLNVADGDDAARFEDVVASHLRRFAFREELAIDWV